MIRFFKNIDDFWSNELSTYQFPTSVSTGQNTEFHKNYHDDKNNLLQGFDDGIPLREEFFKSLDLTKGAISWTCIVPSNTIPIHQDKFFKLREKYNVDISKCLRYLVFLENWTLGHYVEFEECIITKWRKGDVWVFNYESQHCAANASHKNFYTCQINVVDNDAN